MYSTASSPMALIASRIKYGAATHRGLDGLIEQRLPAQSSEPRMPSDVPRTILEISQSASALCHV